jgi:hypothetical protein
MQAKIKRAVEAKKNAAPERAAFVCRLKARP